MRRSIGGVVGVGMAAALLASSVAALGAERAERELLKVRLWRGYQDVLAKHGEPTRVVAGLALPPVASAQGQLNTGINQQPGGMFGLPGMGGGPTMPGGRGMADVMSGAPPMMMGGGMAGLPGMTAPGMTAPGYAMGGSSMMLGPAMGGMTAPPGAAMRGRGGGKEEEEMGDGMAGAPMGRPSGGMNARMSAMMGGMPGSSGMMPPSAGLMTGPTAMMGASSGVGAPLAGRTTGAAQGAAPVVVVDEVVRDTWIYEKGAHTFYFCFNPDGRVVKIQSFGKGSGATGRGIALGDPVSKVYRAYGWPGASLSNGAVLTLDYSQSAHVTFDVQDQGKKKGLRVVAITIAPAEKKNR